MMESRLTLPLLLLTGFTLADGFYNEYGLTPDSEGGGVLASPNFPFSHSWPDRSYTLFAARPGNVCFRFYRFLLAESEDYFKVHTENTVYIFHDKGYNVNGSSEMANVWQEHLCFPVDEATYTLRMEIVMSSQRYVRNSDEPYGFYARYTVGVQGPIPTSPVTVPCSFDEYRCFGETTVCVRKSDVCGATVLCPNGTDHTFAHARCFNGDEAWDMEESGRSSQMLYKHRDSRDWRYTTKTYDHPISLHSDHTNIEPRSALGGYLRVDPHADEATLHVTVPSSMHSKALCFQFWYFMKGPRADYLMLAAQFGSSQDQTVVWSRRGGLDNEWFQGQVEFGANSKLRWVSFLAGQDRASDVNLIGLDDISWSEGACAVGDDVSTTFGIWSGQKWSYGSGEPDAYTYTERTLNHHGKDFSIRAPGSHDRLWIRSPRAATLNKDMCLSFWYNTHGAVEELNVRTISTNSEVDHVTTRRIGTAGNYWRRYWAEFPGQKAPYQVEVNITAQGGAIHVSEPVIIYHSCLFMETCVLDEFQCADNRCIPGNVFCDGKPDCDDGSDERYSSGCKRDFNRNLRIGLSIAVPVLVASTLVAFFLWRKRKTLIEWHKPSPIPLAQY